SARASTEAGTSKPIAFAVLRLTTSSYLVGACTGFAEIQLNLSEFGVSHERRPVLERPHDAGRVQKPGGELRVTTNAGGGPRHHPRGRGRVGADRGPPV